MVLRTLSLLLLVAACGHTRVQLRDVPNSDAPERERVDAYKDLAPQGGQQTTYLRNGVPVGTSFDFLVLGDGTQVGDPRDLKPAVAPQSPAGRAIEKYDVAVQKLVPRQIVSASLIGAGTLASLISIPFLLNGNAFDSSPRSVGFGLLIGGASFAVVSWLVMTFVNMGPAREAYDSRIAAFMTYDRSLRERLALDPVVEEPPKKRSAPIESTQLPADAPLRVALQ
jgi:hypothetical protein